MVFKILVVDDSKLARMAVVRCWAAFILTGPASRPPTLTRRWLHWKSKSQTWSVVDFNMPGRDGLEIAAEVRRMRPAMPVAVISATTNRRSSTGLSGRRLLLFQTSHRTGAQGLSRRRMVLRAAGAWRIPRPH